MIRSELAETLRQLDVELREAASDDDVRAAVEAAGRPLPDDYASLLRVSDGAEGWLGDNYLQIHHAKEAAEATIAFAEFVPGLFFFGGDGAAGLFAFDLRTDERPVVITHTDDLNLETLVRVAGSLTAFIQFLQKHDWIELWSAEYPPTRRSSS